MRIFSSIGAQHFLMLLLALGTLLSLVILTTSSVQASAVTINDQSHVLDTGKVRSEAAQFPDPLLIYTTDTFSGDQDSLNQQTQQFVTDSKEVVIGIDTVHRHLSIESGTNAHLSESQASDAVSAFRTSFNGGDYTGATISAVDSLQTSLGGSSASGVPTGVVVAILLGVGGLVLVVVSFIRRRTTGGGRPPGNGGGRRWGWNNGFYGTGYDAGSGGHNSTHSNSGSYGGGAGGSFGGGGFGGGAGGSFGGGGGAGGSF